MGSFATIAAADAYQLRFESLFQPGRALAFPCDAARPGRARLAQRSARGATTSTRAPSSAASSRRRRSSANPRTEPAGAAGGRAGRHSPTPESAHGRRQPARPARRHRHRPRRRRRC
ncbi:MAG: hypothetical protein MZW92_22435 [Comamonadaceae bacterium]|nr:hypothetical protein [Comamonadaceae bacterium]